MPSNKVLEQKQAVVAELAQKLRDAKAGVLVKYEGITVEDDTKLRAALRAAGVHYTVMKNTLLGKACDEVHYGDLKQYLSGMTAIALGTDDPIAPAKILKQYSEKVEKFEIKAGFVEGEILDLAGVMQLADIPSKEALIAKLLGSMMSPLYGLAYSLQAIVDKNGEGAAEASVEEAPAAEQNA